jgi:hypothetical protein
VSEKVVTLWDQRPIRIALSVLAAAVLVVGVVAFVESRGHSPAVYAGGGQVTTPDLSARYGAKIPLPAAVRTVTRSFVRDAVLRKDTLAARDLVSPQLRAQATDAQWAAGSIPVPQFPASVFGGAAFKVLRSRQRDAILEVQMGSTKPTYAPNVALLIELRPVHGHWLVVSAAPRNSIPIPAA